jgi:hypothetical protein
MWIAIAGVFVLVAVLFPLHEQDQRAAASSVEAAPAASAEPAVRPPMRNQ